MRCDWGRSWVLKMKTVLGTSYHFNFHQDGNNESRAHTVVFGSTGAGKTLLVNLLITGALEHFPDLRVFSFDRDYGQYVAATAGGGRYLRFGRQVGRAKPISLMPFGRDFSDDMVRRHIGKLLTFLSDPTTTETVEQTREMVDVALQTFQQLDRPQDRRLSEVLSAISQPNTEPRRNLERWCARGQYGTYFDALRDDAGLSGSRWTVIDSSTFVSDPVLATPIVFELTERIREEVRANGAPGLIVLDEARALLENPKFCQEFRRWMEELRKSRTAVVSLWQRPSQLAEISERVRAQGEQVNLNEMLRANCATQIFLRDPQARPELYADWDLTEREYEFISGSADWARDFKYAALIRKPDTGESVVVDTNIGSLGDLMHIYRSGVQQSTNAMELQARYPGEEWVPAYVNGEAAH